MEHFASKFQNYLLTDGFGCDQQPGARLCSTGAAGSAGGYLVTKPIPAGSGLGAHCTAHPSPAAPTAGFSCRFSSPLHPISNPHFSQINNPPRCPLHLLWLFFRLCCHAWARLELQVAHLPLFVFSWSQLWAGSSGMLKKVQCGSGEPTHLH